MGQQGPITYIVPMFLTPHHSLKAMSLGQLLEWEKEPTFQGQERDKEHPVTKGQPSNQLAVTPFQ